MVQTDDRVAPADEILRDGRTVVANAVIIQILYEADATTDKSPAVPRIITQMLRCIDFGCLRF